MALTMYRDPRFFQHFNPFSSRDGKPPSLLQKAVALLVTVLVFGLALMASVVLFAIVLSIGSIAWGYLWWKTRKLRQQMRARAGEGQSPAGQGEMVIEGEVIRVVEISSATDEDPQQPGRR